MNGYLEIINKGKARLGHHEVDTSYKAASIDVCINAFLPASLDQDEWIALEKNEALFALPAIIEQAEMRIKTDMAPDIAAANK